MKNIFGANITTASFDNNFTWNRDMRSARTVAGHEAARLSSQLAASQRQRRSREVGTIVEPRARSYDHQRQEKQEKGKCALIRQFFMSVSRYAKNCGVNVNASLISQQYRLSWNIDKLIYNYIFRYTECVHRLHTHVRYFNTLIVMCMIINYYISNPLIIYTSL